MHDVAREHAVRIAERHVRIGEIGPEQLVVFLDACAEKQRPQAVQPQPQPRDVARALVIEALLSRAVHPDVAVQIEHGEGVAVLQHRIAFARARRGGQDVELVLDLNYVFHATSCWSPRLFTASDCARS